MKHKSLLPLALLLAGCNLASAGENLRTVKMKLGTEDFTLEVADTGATQQKGLMQRDSMPADHGMIFVFAKCEQRGFWMKNTRIPLDILYVDDTGKIVTIKHMKAYDLHVTPSDFPAKYAIELNAGSAARCGAKVGDVLEIPKDAKEPADPKKSD